MSGYLGGVIVILSINIILAYAIFLPVASGQLNLGGAAFQAVGAYAAGFLATSYEFLLVAPALLVAMLPSPAAWSRCSSPLSSCERRAFISFSRLSPFPNPSAA